MKSDETTSLLTCAACGRAAPAGSRYCPHCAAPLAAPAATTLSGGEPAWAARSAGPPARTPAHRRTALSGWIKALIVALVVGVVAAVTVAVVLAVGIHRASTNFDDALTPRPGRPSGYYGPAYAGMIVQDLVAGSAGASIAVNGETLTAGALVRAASVLGPTLCSAVTVANHSLVTKDVSPLEWRLQEPNGNVETFGLTGSLQTGQIAPGGTAAGTVCFRDTGQSGTFALLWQPLLRVGRGVWFLHF